MANTHEYAVRVTWQGGKDGSGVVLAERSGTQNTLAVPPEFQGTGMGTNPEELLASAVASCYSITYGIIAANRKLPLESLETQGVGEVEQSGAQFQYTRITLKPRIVLEAGATDQDVQAAEEMAHKADLYCIITNAVRDKVRIEVQPEIIRS